MIKKTLSLLLLISVLIFVLGGLVLYYPEIEPYLNRLTFVPIDTAEIDAYYDLLSEHKRSGKELVVDLGMSDADGLEVAIDKLKAKMGLSDVRIGLGFHNEEKPPAYIKKEGDDMTVFVSTRITNRREEINLLAHELSHIYVWKLKESIFGACNQEKLVDCASVFLGLGVLTLNGLTDEYTVSPDGGYETRKKTFGYLEPNQFAYLLARYCAEHNIKDDAVKPYLGPAGRKYFKVGSRYLRKRTRQTRTPARLVPVKSAIGRKY
ncbi:MAG: hypothetical protein NTY34_05870 [Candidatus Omnitrophica bacterium]|nr:hypothetical protein [Candidatus Omnitrophota bacterium]